MKSKTLYFLFVSILCISLSGCSLLPQKDYNVDKENKNMSEGEQEELGFIDVKLDENLYISAELNMPETNLYEYKTELKKFNYEKVQEVLWPDAAKSEISTDECGSRYYKESSFGGEQGSLIYRRNDTTNYLDTLCKYAYDNKLMEDKELTFMSKEEAKQRMQELFEQLDIGGNLSTPDIVAMNEKDLKKIQKNIMNDEDYSYILSEKNLGNDDFKSDVELYYLKYSIEVNGVSVYGRDEPVLQQTSDLIIAQQMGITAIVSNNGIELLQITGVLEPLNKQNEKVNVMGEDGIKAAIDKKFGDVILTDEYKATNIWMEYFPLLEEGSFTNVNLIPVWCVDFEVNGEMEKDNIYTLRFRADTGDEIS